MAKKYERKFRSIPLTSIPKVRTEMAKLYREARNGEMSTCHAKELSSILARVLDILKIEYEIKQNAAAKEVNKQNWTQNITIYKMNSESI